MGELATSLPAELLAQVFDLCDTPSLVRLSRTCVFLHNFVHETCVRKKEYPPSSVRLPIVDVLREKSLVQDEDLPPFFSDVNSFVKGLDNRGEFTNKLMFDEEIKQRKKGRCTVTCHLSFGHVREGRTHLSSWARFDMYQRRSTFPDKRAGGFWRRVRFRDGL